MTNFFHISFDAFLKFLGIRSFFSIIVPKKPHCEDVIYRKIYKQKTEQEEFQEYIHQPRQLTRLIYRKHFRNDLSPRKYNNNHHDDDDIDIFDDTCVLNVEQHLEQQQNQQNLNSNSSSNSKLKLKQQLLTIASWLYTGFIYTLMFIPIGFEFYDTIHDNNNNQTIRHHLSDLCLRSIYPVQYFASIRYFATTHFDTHVLNRMLPDSIRTHIILICVLAVFLIINNILVELFIYNTKVVYMIYCIPYNIYTNLILCTNAYTYTAVFYTRYLEFSRFFRSIQCTGTVIPDTLTVTSILEDTLKHAYLIQNAVQLLENMYTSLLLLGFFAFTLELPSLNPQSFPWSLYISFLFIMTFFTYIIVRIQSTKSNLTITIRSQPFVKKFLRRYTIDEIQTRFSRNLQNIDLIQLNLQEENSSVLDWFVLNDVLTDQWIDFKIMGINVNDFDLMKRIVLLYFMFFTVNDAFCNLN